MRTLKPIDWETVFSSVRKTGRLLALDTGPTTGSVAGEIVARVSMECFKALKGAPQRLACADFPTPTSFSLTKEFYKGSEDIAEIIGTMLGKEVDLTILRESRTWPHDVPGDWFKGPF